MRDFELNLAVSDPLSLFDHTEFDGEGIISELVILRLAQRNSSPWLDSPFQ